jgi:hypothetical protein
MNITAEDVPGLVACEHIDYSSRPDFQPWPKIPRLRNETVTITEKLNGSCACLCVTENGEVFAASRNRWVTPGKNTDNFGFAQWVREHKEDCLKLGIGRHFGEWYGQGIGPFSYGLKEKRLALFNTFRPADTLPPGIEQVKVLYQGTGSRLTDIVNGLIAKLNAEGSQHVPGYMKPEGLVVYSSLTKSRYKVLCENDEGRKSNPSPEETE